MSRGEPDAVLGAHQVSLRRGGALVLDGVSLDLEPGTITAICGPNGAGKSSLLLTLAGLLRPHSGIVTLGADALTVMPPRQRARKIGYMAQSHDIAWDVSVGTLVALGRLPFGDGESAHGAGQVVQAIAKLDLEALRHRPVSALSGGERARALFARVLAGAPECILADEPFAALDLAHQVNLMGHLRNAADEGRAIAIVLHDLALARNHADKVIILDEGKPAAFGPPRDALSAELIANIWGVEASWLGETGSEALLAQKATR